MTTNTAAFMGLLSATALNWMWDGKPDLGHVGQRLPGRPGGDHRALRLRHGQGRRSSSALLAGLIVVVRRVSCWTR